jgi:hypothetical protein
LQWQQKKSDDCKKKKAIKAKIAKKKTINPGLPNVFSGRMSENY